MPFRLFFVGFCSFARRKMFKGKKRERSRTFVEIVFFAAGWVTGVHVVVVHDDGDVLIFGGKRERRGVRVRVKVKKEEIGGE